MYLKKNILIQSSHIVFKQSKVFLFYELRAFLTQSKFSVWMCVGKFKYVKGKNERERSQWT